MKVDDESKKAALESVVTVDATKVTEEYEEDMGTRRRRRGDEGEVSLWADVRGEETL